MPKKEALPASKYYFSDLIVKQASYSPNKLPHNLYPEQHHLLKQFKGYLVVIEPRQLTKEDCDPNAPVDKLNKQLHNLSDAFEKSFITTVTPYK